MNRNAALIVVTLVFVAIVAVCAYNFSGAETSTRQRFALALDSYREQGLLVEDAFREYQFRRPSTSQFDAGSTLRQITDSEVPAEPGTLVSSKEFLGEAVDIFTAGTDFEGKVRLNELGSSNELAIIFLKRDPWGLAASRGCIYVGRLGAVLCDTAYVEQYFREISHLEEIWPMIYFDLRSGKESLLQDHVQLEIRRMLRASFVLWLLGHEIGHAVRHATSVNGGAHRGAELADTDYDKREIEADDFVVQQLIKAHKDDESWAAHFVLAFNTLLEHEYRKHMDPGRVVHWEAQGVNEMAGREPIVVACGRHDLPLVVRFVRLLDAATSEQQRLDDTGHYILAKSNINLEYTTVSPMAFAVCAVCLLVLVLALTDWNLLGRGKT